MTKKRMDNDDASLQLNTADRPSISLPSSLQPTRVSISNNYQMDETKAEAGQRDRSDDSGENNVFSDPAKAFDTVSPDGKTVKLQASPLSATKRLYGNTSSNDARPLAGVASRGSVGQYDSKSSSPSKRGGRGDLPSILPNSAFLTPKKPSQSVRYSQTNGALSTPRSAASTSRVPSIGGGFNTASSSTGATFAEQQQRQPNLYLANQPPSTTSPLHSAAGSTSPSRSGSTSTRDHANTSYANAGNTGTLGSSFGGESHARAVSHGTLRSKASNEPLIAGSSPTSVEQQRSRRKNSKTGSITGLLGLRNSPHTSTSPRQRQESYSTTRQGTHMPTVSESPAEKSRTSLARPQSAMLRNGNGDVRSDAAKGSHSESHTVVPVISSKTNKPMRNYQVYRELQRQQKSTSLKDKEKPSNPALAYGRTNYGGNNRFLLGGRLVTSGDSPLPFIASFLLSVALIGAFFAFEAQWLWDASPSGIGSPGGKAIIFLFLYAALIMWTSMLRTSLRDPGIIVKGLDPEPDWESVAVPVGGEDDLTGTGMGQQPKLRYFRVRDDNVSSKWCETCQTYRPPRTSHCRLCDVCTEQTDHHCSFLNNCIGRRNYSSFVACLIAAVICCAFTIGVSIAHLARKASSGDGFWNDWRNIGSIILLALSTAVAIPISGLLAYHCRLIWLSKTTIEILRPKYPSTSKDGSKKSKYANPYAYSRRIDNIVYNLCKPMDLYSAIQPHAWAQKDAREENPALV
ncbi:hypothetical protein P389DRAFT_167155 [Cystobasidium minutum MCA 4210]|uniref:uncharacterized protein n=1 Tax=Cystobasidium minutum MCA 4210 TaxID=1397322 RepID=UPI0034CDEEDB|eukprot:jgi/Rhomi1/167155/fgenesh1_kg.2_\